MAGRNLLAPEPQPRKGRNLLAGDYPNEPDYSKPPAQEPGLGGMVAAPVFGDSLPDVARVGVDAYSYGGADAMAGGNQRQLTDEARQRLGYAAVPVDFVGGLLSPVPGSKAKLVQQGGKVAKTGYHAVVGGAQSAADAFGHGQSWTDVGKAGLEGAGLSGAFSTVADPVLSWMSRRKQRKALPTSEDFTQGSRDKYEEVRAKGGVYSPRETRKLLAQFNNMDLSLDASGEAKQLRNWLNTDWKNKAIPPDTLDRIRRIVSQKTRKGGDEVKNIGAKFIEGMDKFAERTPVTTATGAKIPGVNDLVRDARKEAQKGFQMREVEKAQPKKRGFLNYAGEASETPSRNRFGALEKKAEAGQHGFSPEAKQQIADVAQGTKTSAVGELARRFNPARSRFFAPITAAGNFFPGIGSIPTAVAGGMEVATQLGKASTAKQIDDLKSIIATGSKVAADPVQVAKTKDALAKIMSSGVRTGQRNRYGGPR